MNYYWRLMMYSKKNVLVLIFTALLFVLSGCGDGNDDGGDGTSSNLPDTPNEPSAIIKMQLLDAPISGVTYTCADGQSFVTDDNGSIVCEGFPITFKIGNIIIGELTQQGPDLFVTPQDLLGIARSQLDDETLMQLIVFLQSLDDDGIYTDHISIPLAYREKLAHYSAQQFIDLNASKLAALYQDLNVTIVQESDAMNHLVGSLLSKIDTCNFISDHNVTIAMNTRATIFINGLAKTSVPSVTQPPNGASAIYTVANEFINTYYTPDVNFTGEDHFTFTIDGCTKNINMTVLGEVALEPAPKDFAAVYFPDENGICRAMVTDANVISSGTKAVKPYLCEESGKFAKFFYKVNNRFVYEQDEGSAGVPDDRLYAINSNGTQVWLNEDDISGVKAPYDHCTEDHQTYMHQTQVLLRDSFASKPLVLKKKRPGEFDRLIYTALSPENTSSPIIDGMAAGALPWLTEGYKKEIVYGDPSYGGSLGPDGCILIYYHGFEATFLMNDIVVEGFGGDKVISPYVEMDDFVYYFAYDGGAVHLDRFDPNWRKSLTMSFLYEPTATDWIPILAQENGQYDSLSQTASIATDNSGSNDKNYIYLYYSSDNMGDNLIRSDVTANGTTVISTNYSGVTFEKIHTLLGWVQDVSNSAFPGTMVPHYKDTIFYKGYNTTSGKVEIGKINDDGTFTMLVDNAPSDFWSVVTANNIYYAKEGATYDAFYHYDGSTSTLIELGLGRVTSGDKSYIKSMKNMNDRVYVMTENSQTGGNNLLLVTQDGNITTVEQGFSTVLTGLSSTAFSGSEKITVFSNSTSYDTIIYSTVDGNASAGYEHRLYEYNVLSGTKKLIR